MPDDPAKNKLSAALRSRGASLPLEVWDEVEAAPSPIGPLRKCRGLTQEALAAKAQISPAYLSELEAGEKTADVQTLQRLAEALSVSLDDLTPDEEGPNGPKVKP